ncbi:general amidase [Fusarium beomiforme]|uniref:General amidase n=1 Tax=Fusarium beomiforme TaxID=44412 RepID=A0A9P5AQJ8_9HYPO|nr:general amidase [Fusarium beomiforme]
MSSPLITRRNGKKQAYQVPRLSGPSVSQQSVAEESGLNAEAAESTAPQTRNFGPDDGLWSSPAARHPQGFFGPTSFPAAYLETEASLAAQGPASESIGAPPSPVLSTPPSMAEIQSMVNVDQGASQLAVKVLQALPDRPQGPIARPESTLEDDWLATIGEVLITSTWDTFGTYLQDRENIAKLREMGSRICINTRKTLLEDQDDPAAWIESFSGQNLRWETVGVIFLNTALAELSSTSNQESRRIIRQCTEYCAPCITLANMGGSSGSLMLFLMYKRSVLHAWMHGETSLPYWKFHAETVAMLTFSGLHDNLSKSAALNVSTVPSEIRRRIGCQIFIVDKFLATFVGRPPLLTRRFCSIKLPLDIKESALLADKENFQRQHLHLDQSGWNTDGSIYASSLLRVRMMIALVRDEILEVILAQDGDYSITDIMYSASLASRLWNGMTDYSHHNRKLKAKQLDLYRQLPDHLIWDPAPGEIRDIDLDIGYPKLLIRLDHLLSMFLIQRLFVKHGHPRNDLLRTSFEMVVLTLNFWTQKHIWAALQGKCRWIIMGYATLAGAVLCMELIEPIPVTMSAHDNVIAGETYSRSSIIQQLSLLLGYLKTSCPSQTHCSVAHNVRGVIKKVLDHILNSSAFPVAAQTVSEFEGFDLSATFFDENGAKLTIKEVELKQPGPGYLLVKVLACGVCHTDIWIQQGRFGNVFPRTPGHEAVGDVVAVGDGVKNFKTGDRVGGAWHGGHDGTCRSCQQGIFQLCDNEAINGVTMNGGYAEYVLLRAEAAVRVPSHADPAEVAPLLCAGVTVFNAMRNMAVMQGGLVAVQGLGGLGHLAIQFASKMGYTVVALSAGSEKKDFAMELGAHHYIDSSKEDACEALQKLGGANMILSTAPKAEAITPLTAGLTALGKLVVLSPMGPVEFNTVHMIVKGLSIHGWNSGHQQDSEDTIAFAQTHGIKCIVEKFDFSSEYQEAFDKMESGKVRFRADRDAAIAQCEARLPAVSDEKVVPEHADISYLLERLSLGQLSAETLVSVTIRRAIASHKDTNCISEPLFERALDRAKYLDEYFQQHQKLIGPLHGIPVSVKDQFNVTGVDTTLGYVGRSFKPATENAVMVSILEKLGAVIITKTVIPQSIMYGETESPLWGLTTYPGRPELSPGGSTGGEATLMAMSGSLGGWATDIGGSIRVPSHLNGLFGLKPSSGRFSYSGAANSHEGQSHVPSSIGPMSPLLSNLITITKESLNTEPWKLDPNVVPIPWRQDDFESVQKRKLTIGVILDDGVVRPHPEIQEAIRRVVAIFEKAGHKVIPWSTADHGSCIEIQDKFYRVDGGEDIKTEVAVAGEPMIAHVEALVNSSKAISVYEYWQLNRRKTAAQEAYNKKWTATAGADKDGSDACVDIIISPMCPHTAVPHRCFKWTGYAKIWNFLDYTAMSFPFAKFGIPTESASSGLYVSATEAERQSYLHDYAPRNPIDEWVRGLYNPEAMEGLNIGVQIIGRRYEEERVLGVAALLEKLVAAS